MRRLPGLIFQQLFCVWEITEQFRDKLFLLLCGGPVVGNARDTLPRRDVAQIAADFFFATGLAICLCGHVALLATALFIENLRVDF